MNYLPTCTSRLVVQYPCQVSFQSMQGCRRSWEDKLKCVKILSAKDHNSAKICRTWIISPHALLDLWCNIPVKFHLNPCKDVGGVEKTNFVGTEWQNDGRKEWRTKQTLNAPLPFYGGGIKRNWVFKFCIPSYLVIFLHYQYWYKQRNYWQLKYLFNLLLAKRFCTWTNLKDITIPISDATVKAVQQFLACEVRSAPYL